MKYTMIIRADTNDADYITREHIIDDEELKFIKKVVNVLKDNATKAYNGRIIRYRWPTSEYVDDSPSEMYKDELSEDEIDYFDEYVPYGEQGVHTIESIRITPQIKWEDLLKEG